MVSLTAGMIVSFIYLMSLVNGTGKVDGVTSNTVCGKLRPLAMFSADVETTKEQNVCVTFTSCQGQCGEKTVGCYCDDFCWFYGDCCHDYLPECLKVSTRSNDETVLTAILSQMQIEYFILDFRIKMYWIQQSECILGVMGPHFIIKTCSREPLVTEKFKNVLNNIRLSKKRDLLLKYLSSLSTQDIIKRCEKSELSRNESLQKLYYLEEWTFSNIFCAVCNGIFPRLQYLYCNMSKLSLTSLTDITEKYKCIFGYFFHPRICSSPTEVIWQFDSYDKNLSHCYKIKYSFNIGYNLVTFRNINCLRCIFDDLPETIGQDGTWGDCQSVECNCSELYKNITQQTLSFIYPYDFIQYFMNVRNKDCKSNQIFLHWTGQCTDVLCPDGYQPYIHRCYKAVSCSSLRNSDDSCLNLRPMHKGRFLPLSQLFTEALMPAFIWQTFITLNNMTPSHTEQQSEPLIETSNNNEHKEFMNRRIKLDYLFEQINFNTLNDTNLRKIRFVDKLLTKFHETLPKSRQFNDFVMNDFGKIVEFVKCFHGNKSCVHGNVSQQRKVTRLSDIYNNIDINDTSLYTSLCSIVHAIGASTDACVNYVMSTVSSDRIDNCIYGIIKETFSFYKHVLNVKKAEIKFSNRPLRNFSSLTQTKNNLTNIQDNLVKCSEGRQLLFSNVDYQMEEDEIKLYVDKDELPVENIWLELSTSTDKSKPVIDSAIISLCVLPLGDVHPCPYNYYIQFPYSDLLIYKQLLLISEDITEVSEYIKRIRHTIVSPIDFIEQLGNARDLKPVFVFYKTSYILSRVGASVCVDPADMYHDDKQLIQDLYSQQSAAGSPAIFFRHIHTVYLIYYFVSNSC